VEANGKAEFGVMSDRRLDPICQRSKRRARGGRVRFDSIHFSVLHFGGMRRRIGEGKKSSRADRINSDLNVNYYAYKYKGEVAEKTEKVE
jgi:hypothetical protein